MGSWVETSASIAAWGEKKAFSIIFSYETTHSYPGCTPAQFQIVPSAK